MNGLGERNERPFLTLSQAAKRVGKSKATISKAIADGRLSVAKRETTGFKIDPAELFRVFTPNCSPNGQTERNERVSELGERPQVNTPNTPQAVEVEVLKARLQAAEQRIADQDRLISDYRRIVDKLLLPGPEQVNETPRPQKKRSWWRHYFKGED